MKCSLLWATISTHTHTHIQGEREIYPNLLACRYAYNCFYSTSAASACVRACVREGGRESVGAAPHGLSCHLVAWDLPNDNVAAEAQHRRKRMSLFHILLVLCTNAQPIKIRLLANCNNNNHEKMIYLARY